MTKELFCRVAAFRSPGVIVVGALVAETDGGAQLARVVDRFERPGSQTPVRVSDVFV
jgi:hypothetical protein